MSAQLGRFLCRLHSLPNVRFSISGINKHFHLQSSRFAAENNVEISANAASKTELNAQGRGFDINNPVLVAATTKKVIVGCNCTPDDPTLKWFYLEEGPAQVCDCGIYFKMDKVKQGTSIPEYSHVMQVDDDIEDMRQERSGLPFRVSSKSKKTAVQQK